MDMFFNLVNGDTYIGSSVKLDRRFRVHLSCIGSVNLPLYNAINKYGLNNFIFIILQYCDPIEDLCLALEQSYLDQFKPNYNILKLARSSTPTAKAREGLNIFRKLLQNYKKIHAANKIYII